MSIEELVHLVLSQPSATPEAKKLAHIVLVMKVGLESCERFGSPGARNALWQIQLELKNGKLK